MSEDNVNVNNDSDLKKEIEQLKKENAAKDMKLRRSDEDLYSEDYLEFLQKKKEQKPQNSLMSGGRLSDYSNEELQGMPVSKMAKLMMGEVYSQLKDDEGKRMTTSQAKARKQKVDATRIEIKKFAEKHSDFWNYAARIDELAAKNPNLDTEQLYQLAGGELEGKEPPPKKQEPKQAPKIISPNTRPQNEGGMKQSDKNLSRREIIQQEYQKLK